MSLSADTGAGDPPFDFEEKIPSEILHLILSYNFPQVNEHSHFASLAQVNKRWSAEISGRLLSWISIPVHLDLEKGEKLMGMLASSPQRRLQVKCVEADGSDFACRLLTLLPDLQTLILSTESQGILTYTIPRLPNLSRLEVKLAAVQSEDFFPSLQDCCVLRDIALNSSLDWTNAMSTVKFENLETLRLQLWTYNETIFDAFLPSCSKLRNITLRRVRKPDFKLVNDLLTACCHLDVFSLQADFQRRNMTPVHLPDCLRILNVESMLFQENDEGPLELGIEIGCFFSNLTDHLQLRELRLSGTAMKDCKMYGLLPNLQTCSIDTDVGLDADALWFDNTRMLHDAQEEVKKSYLSCLEPSFLQENFRFLVISSGFLEDLKTTNNLFKRLAERQPPISLSVEFRNEPSQHCAVIFDALMKFTILHLYGLGVPGRKTLHVLDKVLGCQSKNIVLFSCDMHLFNYVQSGMECPFEDLKVMIIPWDNQILAENQMNFCRSKGVDFLRASVSQSVVTRICRKLGIWD
ncbi:hypothetical protein BT69DRAFT_362138 [Atractiella rhizophila]|nr:hypothetical protein BT69DRAFT_362138 [Atractiella rhizophila]